MADTLAVMINGRQIEVPAGSTVAAAIALAGETAYRRSTSGEARAPLCGMGICYECRVTINGRPHQLSCQALCAEGMQVEGQGGRPRMADAISNDRRGPSTNGGRDPE